MTRWIAAMMTGLVSLVAIGYGQDDPTPEAKVPPPGRPYVLKDSRRRRRRTGSIVGFWRRPHTGCTSAAAPAIDKNARRDSTAALAFL